VKRVALALLLVTLASGCGFAGREEKDTIIMVEPGDTVEIQDSKKVMVHAVYKDDKGNKVDAYEKRSVAGCVAMPKSVYSKMRVGYIALYDFVNGKITEAEMRERLKESKGGTAEADQTK
jgi:hypothetical protein